MMKQASSNTQNSKPSILKSQLSNLNPTTRVQEYKTMATSANKPCGVCSGTLDPMQQGQPMFTAVCLHSFHFHCITPTLASGDPRCPSATLPGCPSHIHLSLRTSSPTPFVFNPHSYHYLPSFPVGVQLEPLHFSDDDPLLDPNHVSSDSSDGVLGLAITGVPECPAIAAAESVPLFTLLVGLKAPALSHARAPIDLVTVLDVSGSMSGSKLALVKQAVRFVIDNLGPSDRLSIVSFSSQAKRILRLRRMSESGREETKRAVDSLMDEGATNIVEGLKKGVQVLEERRQANPVSTIIFLSDGNDTCHGSFFQPTFERGQSSGYLHLLPGAIRPANNPSAYNAGQLRTIPVHSFGFGSDHDPIAMHAISDASGGTFSFIELHEVVQDAFAGCIGGLLSVVAQEVRLTVRAASHGVVIKSIPSGRYAKEIIDNGSGGTIVVGDVYADEHKEFLINVFVPSLPNGEEETPDAKISILDITCTYLDVASKESKHVEGELVEVRRPKTPSLTEMMVNLAIDRQRNRVLAAEAITEAQQMAETGDLMGARRVLSKKRNEVRASMAGQAGDGLTAWLEADMMETEARMQNQQGYQQFGRAYALSGMSSHGFQRATMQSTCFGAPATASGVPQSAMAFGGYATPNMANMVMQSQQLRKADEGSSKKQHDEKNV